MKAVQFTFLLLVFYCFKSSKYQNFIFLVVLVSFLVISFCLAVSLFFLRLVCGITLMEHFHSERCGCHRTGVSSASTKMELCFLKRLFEKLLKRKGLRLEV